MKKLVLVLSLVILSFGLTAGQKRPSIKQVQITSQTVGKQSTSIDLTSKGTIYTLAAGVDYSRIRVRTSKGEMTMADLLKKTGKSVSGKLRVGMTSDIRTQKLNLTRMSGRTLNFSCEGILCTCSGDDDCNDMFTRGGCGDIAVCDEHGCWCFRL